MQVSEGHLQQVLHSQMGQESNSAPMSERARLGYQPTFME